MHELTHEEKLELTATLKQYLGTLSKKHVPYVELAQLYDDGVAYYLKARSSNVTSQNISVVAAGLLRLKMTRTASELIKDSKGRTWRLVEDRNPYSGLERK